MDRVKMKVDGLEVQSFSTGGGTAVLERPRRAAKREIMPRAWTVETGCYSDALDHTGLCDTRNDCSEACLVATNVCGPCG